MLLYKYASAKGGINILRERQLKVTRPRDFNDPFEFSPRLVGSITPEDVRSHFLDPKWVAGQECAASLRGESFPLPFPSLAQSEEAVKVLADNYNRDAASILREHLEEVSKEFGVACLSRDSENTLMWSHYANQHRGIVIGLDETKLQGSWWPVIYQRERVGIKATTVVLDFDKEMGAKAIFERKGCVWRHENEVRAIYPLEKLPKVFISEEEESVLEIPEDAIIVVKLGNRSSLADQEEVRNVLSKYERSVHVQRATLHPSERLVFVTA
jgi:hypothetical protein